MLGLGYGIASPALWSSRWSPSMLFGVDGQGVVLDPSRLWTLKQDSAGATPVTAAGQQVGMVMDISRRGNNATQSVSAARPTYRIDAGNRPYLEFDGIDDRMATASVALAAGARTVIAAIRKRSDANIGTVMETGPDWSTTPGGINVIAPATAGAGDYGSRTRPVTNFANLNSAASFPAPHTAVISMVLATGTHKLMVNGAEVSGSQPDTVSALNAAINVGGRSNGSRFGALDLYALLVIDRTLTTAEMAHASAWAAARAGVTLP